MNMISCPLCQFYNNSDIKNCTACGATLPSTRVEPVAFNDTGNTAASHDFVRETELPRGTILQNGVFVIERVLGQGGFGITYAGQDLSLLRPVAIKEFFPFGSIRGASLMGRTVHPSNALTPQDFEESKRRFIDEARVVARFKHPAIVDVYAVFEENNTAYMVMELLEGHSLEQLVTEKGAPLEESEALEIADVVGTALEKVHSGGLLHRDIKPQNIVRCNDGRIVLIDFGTAREYSNTQTRGHTVVVTPGYAPLEQYAERAQRGAYTDVYGLAATLYYVLTTQIPPAASDRAMGVELKSAHDFNRDVSATVSAALSRAMETAIVRRPQNVRDFLDELHHGRTVKTDHLLQQAPVGRSPLLRVLDDAARGTLPRADSAAPAQNNALTNQKTSDLLPPAGNVGNAQAVAPLQDAQSPKHVESSASRSHSSQSLLKDSTPYVSPLAQPSLSQNAAIAARQELLQDTVVKQPTTVDTHSAATQQHLLSSPNATIAFKKKTDRVVPATILFLISIVLIPSLISSCNNGNSQLHYNAPDSRPSSYSTSTTIQPTAQHDNSQTAIYRFPIALPKPSKSIQLSKALGYDAKMRYLIDQAKFSEDGSRVSAIQRFSGIDTVRVWNTKTGKLLRTFRMSAPGEPPGSVTLEFSPSNNFLAIMNDRELQLREISTGKTLWRFSNRSSTSWNLSSPFSPDGRMLLIAEDSGRAVIALDTRTGKVLYSVDVEKYRWTSTLKWQNSGKTWLHADYTGRLSWHDAKTGKLMRRENFANDTIRALSETPRFWLLHSDNKCFVRLKNDSISTNVHSLDTKISEDTSRSQLDNFLGQEQADTFHSFARNGSMIAIIEHFRAEPEDSIDYPIKEKMRIYDPSGQAIYRGDFWPGFKHLRVSLIRIIRLTSDGKVNGQTHIRGAQAITFSRDGQTLTTLDENGTLMTWNTSKLKWVKYAN